MSFSKLVLLKHLLQSFPDTTREFFSTEDDGINLETYTPSNISPIVLFALFNQLVSMDTSQNGIMTNSFGFSFQFFFNFCFDSVNLS